MRSSMVRMVLAGMFPMFKKLLGESGIQSVCRSAATPNASQLLASSMDLFPLYGVPLKKDEASPGPLTA